jgi:hypothetical protein
MDLEETEARNDCGGEGQQQFNRPTDQSSKLDGVSYLQSRHVLSCSWTLHSVILCQHAGKQAYQQQPSRLFRGLLYDAEKKFIASNGRTDELEGSGRGLIEVLYRNFPRVTEGNHEKPQPWQVSRLRFEPSTPVIHHKSVTVKLTCSMAVVTFNSKILWHICSRQEPEPEKQPLLGNDRDRGGETRAISRQRLGKHVPAETNKATMDTRFSVRSMPKCYNRDKSDVRVLDPCGGGRGRIPPRWPCEP